MKVAILHRYDNKPDILAVESNRCSEVYRKSKNDNFDIVIVVPTGAARTDLCVYGDATSNQYIPSPPKTWPGRPDKYAVRIDMSNIKKTTLDRVRKAVEAADSQWAGQWTVKTALVDDTLL